jgi:hypothetical protein
VHRIDGINTQYSLSAALAAAQAKIAGKKA